MATHRVRTPEDHLRRADHVLGAVIDGVLRDGGERPTVEPDSAHPPDPDIPRDHYGMLLRAIVAQNISNNAARAIYRRLKERCGGHPPSPEDILRQDPDELRTATGLSRAKTTTLLSLSERILSGELELARLHRLADDAVVAQLVAVKGIGTWTADMFMIFHLHRPDVLPVGDLGIRHAVQKVYELPGPPRPAEVGKIGEPWRPWRSTACMYLWQMGQTTPQV
ncbi:DNA-3-methyladenine glycosylase family protein [Streptomyces brasiliensis]|uniref:DNA-3-methyladenine glycosylase II n=1 Tax=Streptomyces brasiliensis TaxID=1954 RepID=A0A917K0Y7_9ACTN|nr:DNA-3-methyladenine glycosylase 2 family protein [Streptomyces brasiliensis]GGI94233.1 hypothetical protein GCM10010121_000750 [Streptomyces brasiliensis]